MSTAKVGANEQEKLEEVSRLSSIQGVARRLGVSTFTIRRLIRVGALKSVRISRRVLVPESAIRQAIENGCGR